jgi:hypothetical protein
VIRRGVLSDMASLGARTGGTTGATLGYQGGEDALASGERGEDGMYDERETVAACRTTDTPAHRRRPARGEHSRSRSDREHRAVWTVHVAVVSSDRGRDALRS